MGVELGSAYGKIEIDSSGAVLGVNQAQDALRDMEASTRQIGAALTAMGTAMTGAATLSAKSAISLESAFAGVIKTTDGLVGTTGSLTLAGRELKDEFRDMAHDVPVAVEELMAIGELGGQLGVGREALDEFTETIAALGVSTNLTTEEAATALARMSNIYDIETADMGDNVERLGSTIVALGNNFATTESEITNFGLRIAGAGRIAGLSQAEILAIGTAMSSVGVQAEAGGTAVQKVLLGINEAVQLGSDNLQTFAATAGLTVQEFSRLWKEDAATAFTLFVEGLGDAGDEAIQILQELGLEDQRLVRSFLSLSNAGDLLSETIDTANSAWEENTALAKEAGQRYDTTASNLKELGNTAKDVASGLGDYLLPGINAAADGAKQLLEGFQGLPPELQATVAQVMALGGGLTTAAGGAMLLLPKLVGLGRAVFGLAASLGVSTAALLGPAGLIATLGTLVLYAKNVENAHREEAAMVAASSGNYNDYAVQLRAAGLEANGLTQEVYELARAMEEGAESSDPEHYKRMAEAVEALQHEMQRAYEASDLAGEGIAEFAKEQLLALATSDEYVARVITETGEMHRLANVYGLTDDEAREFLQTLQLKAKAHLLNLDAVEKETIVQNDYDDSLGLTREALAELTKGLRDSKPATEDQAAATGMAATEMAALAQQTGLSVQQVQHLATAMGMSAEGIQQYAAALQNAQQMMGGFTGTLASGLEQMRGLEVGTDEYNRAMLELSLQIAEQTGLLTQWSETEFGPDLAPLADSASEVLGLLDSGIIEIDGSLETLIHNMASGVQDALGETEQAAANNQKVITEMMEGLQGEAEQAAKNLQKALDLKDMLPYEDAVAAGIAVGAGLEEGLPDDPFAQMLSSFSGAREAIVEESGLMSAAISSIPTDVDIAAAMSGVPMVLNLAQQVQDAMAEIPRDVHINISASYSGTDGAEWTPSVAIFHALEDLVDLVEDSFPLDLGIRGGGGGGLEPISPEILRGWEGLGPALAGAAEDMDDLLSMAREVSSLGGFFQGLYEEQRVDPMAERLDELNRKIAVYMAIEGRNKSEQMILNKLFKERNSLAKEYEAEQERLMELQEQQQQLQFLEQQQKLLEMIQEHGLDAGEILGGMELGLDASVTDLMEAMKKAMQAMIAAAEDELEIGSPSRVMMEIMRQALVLPAQAVSREAMQAAAMAGAGSARAMAGGMIGEARTDNRSYRSTTVNVQVPAVSNDPRAMAEMTAARLRNEARYGSMN